MQIAIVGLLILLNGMLSMSEFAIVSSRRHRLQQKADAGSKGASLALRMTEDPSRFLSTVQIGITLVGILAGAFGGAAIADDLARVLSRWEAVREIAHGLSLVVVVGATTYFTLVIGELVPKQIAIRQPERVAVVVARPMRALAAITFPLVVVLSASTRLVLRLLGQRRRGEHRVSEEEIKVLLREGEESGVFRRAETRMVAGVFRLDDIRADALMTPRTEVAWLEAGASREQILATMESQPHAVYPICDRDIDHIVGLLPTARLTAALLRGDEPDLRALADEPEFVPESSSAGELVKRSADTGRHFLVVVSEHGGVDGIVTAHDFAEAVLGDLGSPEARRVDDRTWIMSAKMPIEEAEAVLDRHGMRERHAKSFGTVAGFVMNELGRIPSGGESFRWHDLTFTVTRVSGRRIREVRVVRAADDREP